MSATFEDCSILAQCIDTYAPDWKQAFTSYQEQRKKHTDVLANLCVQRFYELKDGFRSKKFLAQDRLDALLGRLLPSVRKPLHTLITHTSIPYADAYKRHQRQQRFARLLGMDLWISLYALCMRKDH